MDAPQPPTTAEELVKRTLSGNFECAVNLTDRRTLKVTGCLFLEDTPAEMHARIDVAQDLLDRQAVRCDIVQKEAQVAGHLQNLENMKEAYAALVAKKQKARKLTSQEELALANFDPSVKQSMAMIDSLRAAIASGKQKINGAAQA